MNRNWEELRSNSHSTICGPRVASRTVRYLGPYGEMAARHMATWRPRTYASIPEGEREQHFLDLDEAVAQAIRTREHSLMPPASLAETDHCEWVAQMNMSHLMAEEEVLAEMVLLEPEPDLAAETGEPGMDGSGAYLDPGWRSPRVELSDEEWEAHQSSGNWKQLLPNQTLKAGSPQAATPSPPPPR